MEEDGIESDGVFSMSEMYNNVHNFGLSVFRPWGNSGGEVTPLITDIPLPILYVHYTLLYFSSGEA